MPAGIVNIPGQPGEQISRKVLADVEFLVKAYHLKVTDGYAPSGHAAGGEHPLGLAVDLVPGPGGSWDDVAKVAAWAKDHPDIFRWVGWNGDPGHGDPAHAGANAHLHLSWHGGPADPPGTPTKTFTSGLKTGDVKDLVPHYSPIGGDPQQQLDEASKLANAVSGKLVGALLDKLGADGTRTLLSIGLVIAALALIAAGAARALGLRTPPIPALAAAKAATAK